MPFFKGKVETDSSFKHLLGSFTVTLRYLKRLDTENFPFETTTPVAGNGVFQLDIDDDARQDGAASVTVAGPTSETYFGSLLSDLLDAGNQLKLIKITAAAPKIALKGLDPGALKPLRRLTVRVFVAANGALTGKAAARTYVQIFGKPKQQSDVVPLGSGTTDATGYFSLSISNAQFDRMIARTGQQNSTTETEISLLDNGFPPDKIILMVPQDAVTEEDCNCDLVPPRLPDAAELAENGEVFSTDLGAGCEDFTLPNRTLEEFDFYKIVRTTDPDIKGLTLPDTVTAEIADTKIKKIAFDADTLSSHLRTSDISLQTTSVASSTGIAAAPGPQPAGDVRLTPMSDSNQMMVTRGQVRQPVSEIVVAQKPDQLPDILPEYVDVRPLEASGTVTGALWRDATDEKTAEVALRASLAKIPAAALRASLHDPDGFTPVSLMTLERHASAEALRLYLHARSKSVSGRGELTQENPPDWDHTPEFYQATSIAHGHLLHFKQEWKADGYSLGELVKSIPLAPGQKKQITMLDWDREDISNRTESRDSNEALSGFVSHDRDINEIANSSFRESIRGGSEATTGAVGGGIGFAIGPLVIGGGGGSAWSGSTAWNDGSRTLTAQTLNQLRDDTSQGVSAVRNQRSTVIETVGQHERVTATTEVIANHNRCHAMTMQYFEVLRHFSVQERLAGVQECLFVPLQMTLFDDAKVLRWRDTLTNACRKRALRLGFESIWRLSSPSTTPPDRAFADDAIEEMSGRMFLRVSIARPKDPDEASQAVLEQTEWRFLGLILRVNPEVIFAQYRRNEQKRDQIFRTEIAPETARLFIESLRVVLIDRDGAEHDAGFDLTLLSRYSEGGLMEVALNDTGNGPRLTRRDIVGVEIRTDFELPEFSKVVVERAIIDYRTERFKHFLYRNDRVLDDVLKGDAAFLSTSSLTRAEERNQLKEDRERRRKLLRHLNDNIEYFHRAIFWFMEANRRFMLLDGFEAPHSGGRSVASVVENRLIGIVGNALVMPVAPGFQLDPALRQALKRNADPLVALQTLYDMVPSPARRHSVPTKGVFAEAMNGKCNSCEVMEEDRFWRWKDFPLPDSPPPISELSTDSRFAAPGSLAPSGFPDALIKFQDIPSAPNPTGMQAALDLLGKDVFKDLTGLTENQKNAMAALTTAMTTSEAFAGEAFKLSMAQEAARNLDRTLGQIESANKSGLLTNEEASKATRDALLRSLGEDATQSKDVTELSGVKEALEQLGTAPSGSASVTRSNGENSETVSVTKEDGSALTIGTAPVAEVREFPEEIWTKTPVVIDGIEKDPGNPSRAIYKKEPASRDADALRIKLRRLITVGGNPAILDLFESAVKEKLLKIVPGNEFELRVRARIGYPADAADKSKIASGQKFPLVIILHGNLAPVWKPIGAPIPAGPPVTVLSGGVPVTLDVFSQALDNTPSYTGFDYLQKFLAEDGRKIISISIDTNLANTLNSAVEMRARCVVDVIKHLEVLNGDPKSFLFNKIDINNIGLLGHSRGGEAVVLASTIRRNGIRAICSLSPTDALGTAGVAALSVFTQAPFLPPSYFVMYGGMDQDVEGNKLPGTNSWTGTGFRLYDRSSSHKAMVFAPLASHNRFNTVWDQSIEGRIALPAKVLDSVKHQSLAQEYIGGFFDLVLNKDNPLESLFRNTKKNAVSIPVAIQWRFGNKVESIDEFEVPLVSRGLTGSAGPVELSPTLPPIAVVTGHRDLHVPHTGKSIVFDAVAAGGLNPMLVEPLSNGADAFKDLLAFTAITFRLGQLYPVGDQVSIDAVQPPKFTVSLTDNKNTSHSLNSDKIYKDMANGWAKPAFKMLNAKNMTQLFMQTVPVNFQTMWDNNLGPVTPPIDYSRITSIKIEFDASASLPEIWLDSLTLVKN